MNNPKCPYCGEEMRLTMSPISERYWYRCDNCDALAPEANSPEEARAAAMKRDRARGEWGKPIWGRDHLDRPIITGAECSICHKVSEFQTHFCPNCGAEMREENDEP